LEETQPDLIVTVAYGRLLPQYVLDYPKYGCINLHGSLLPKYRGAAPIQRAVMNGDTVTGVTTMFLSLGMDEGDMLLKAETEIGADETAGELMDRLAIFGAPVLAETIDRIADGTIVRTPQDPALATHAAMLDKAEGKLDFQKSARELYCIFRGLTPALSVSTTFRGKSVKITAVHPTDAGAKGEPGEIIAADKAGITVATADGALVVTELAPEGKRAMAAADFINGRQVKIGEFFGA
ncbi:MAG: methionyl-tRNA formyltransferase, partial [Clostridia bacterium]|nr:methionyl-tRNA formyltransferase [Clostridia bacterium]